MAKRRNVTYKDTTGKPTFIKPKKEKPVLGSVGRKPKDIITDDEFHFKDSVDMNALSKQIGESLAKTIGRDPKNVKCKGIRFFFVDEKTEVLMSSGLFVKGFSPEDWEDDHAD